MSLLDVFDDAVIEIITENLLAQKLGASLAAFAQSCKRMKSICGRALALYKKNCSRVAHTIERSQTIFCEVLYADGEKRTMFVPNKYRCIFYDHEVILDKIGKVHSYGGKWAMSTRIVGGKVYEWYNHGTFIRQERVVEK